MTAKERVAQSFAREQVSWREEGKREMLTSLLRLKLGDLPARVAERIAEAGRGQLEAWAAKVLTAPTLDAVFGPG